MHPEKKLMLNNTKWKRLSKKKRNYRSIDSRNPKFLTVRLSPFIKILKIHRKGRPRSWRKGHRRSWRNHQRRRNLIKLWVRLNSSCLCRSVHREVDREVPRAVDRVVLREVDRVVLKEVDKEVLRVPEARKQNLKKRRKQLKKLNLKWNVKWKGWNARKQS